ncbi:MAG: hypothetical protein RL885_06125 [Planctomycetota bacterium]
MQWTLIAVGPAIGIAGGVFGTWMSVRAARSAPERAFVIWSSIGILVLVSTFVVALSIIPTWHKHLLWPLYAAGLTYSTRAINRRQTELREAASDADDPTESG